MKNKGNLLNAIKELKADKNNAVAHIYSEIEAKQDGCLKDCVFTIKDNYADLNVKASASSLILNNFYPQYEATVLKLLRNAGAISVARTHLDEFGLGGSGTYSAYGVIKNPLNNEYYVGGSSSGAAATFTKNISFAIGSDTGDSVRKPASNIGVVGFKPSYGAISRYGLYSFATSLDTVAYFTHNVSDCIELSSVLYQQDLQHDLTSIDLSFDLSTIKEVKPKRVGYFKVDKHLSDDVVKAYNNLLNKLKSENIELIEIEQDENILKSVNVVYAIISFSEASSNLANLTGVNFGNRHEGVNWEETYKLTRSNGLGKMVQSRLILGSYFLEQENQIKYFVKAKKMRRVISDYFKKIHSDVDLLIFPASSDCAPKFNHEYNGGYWDYILTAANLTGNPSMTMKLGQSIVDSMPFNITLETNLYQDKDLFSYALYIEKLLGGIND
ncbi:aspartyl/glutamyl-tRNA(Asn/Gln) amidotransferase subunit A [Metamycoplasma cloacale]|uniref:Asp-tRNA(Asn)/Glu-tRNA(Gln) amidotransferase subunit GatA n=1 Tax=Metamycoplasma cloacale TaxID=92401 RepID=A0A2Z4LLQ2_9BACT|nr:amidase family protein [Metamycoplasma cloacale]AWX42645.1 Asp-tRNA(Asn)/Glu-tRNA(Gln) amidotransferase subunit GatA [Metamycoplasma cloacale]VEU79570.1 aspartyl/glutamyl-tRNA(Asn/Gln) amidotransferase subunit A [Metamycoplasma cloacale]